MTIGLILHPAKAAGKGKGGSPLTTFVSFILRQPRGWRLLNGAGLSVEETRSILASTNNKLDYDSA